MSTDKQEDVSRETMEDLEQFEQLALKWTKKINLVSASDAQHIWNRHIIDSMQVFENAPSSGHWMDIGSGGGFPGIVAAIMAKAVTPQREFTLVDSDQRKCAFLRTATRELGLNVTVLDNRIESLAPQDASILSARALGDLNSLLAHAERHLSLDGVALFPKGASWEKEHEIASKHWSYNLEAIKSTTNPDATILKIRELARV